MAVKARDSITLTKVVDGSDGRSIVLFQREFYLSTSKTQCTGGSWSTTQPQWVSGKYLWTRNKITYKNPSSVEYTTPEVDTTWEAIKDIQVGGRNLLQSSMLQSKGATNTKGFTISIWADTIVNTANTLKMLKPSTTYTFSGHAKITGRTSVPTAYSMQCGFLLYSSSTSSAIRNLFFPDLQSSSNKVGDEQDRVVTFTTPDVLPSDYRILVYTRRWTTNGNSPVGLDTVEFTNLKIEKGNKATDWTAAPEDLVSVSEMYYEYYLSTSETELTGGSWTKELPDWTKGVYIWIRTTSLMTDGTYKYTDPKLYNVVQDQVEQMLEDVKSEITTKLEKGDKDITGTVDEMQALVDDNIEAIKNLRSIVSQHSDSITAETKKVLEITNKITGLTTKEEISQWARYEDGVLTLGESNSPFSVKLSTTELGFYESGTRIAYISNQQLHISRAVILEKIQLGTFILEYDDSVGFIIH